MTMLADDHAVEQVTFEDGGILNALASGGVHVSLSTISTALSRRLTEAHKARGQSFVASPVFGRPEAAEAARLVVVAAGPDEAVERVRPLLEAIGRKVFVIGPEPYSANAVKLAGNFLIASDARNAFGSIHTYPEIRRRAGNSFWRSSTAHFSSRPFTRITAKSSLGRSSRPLALRYVWVLRMSGWCSPRRTKRLFQCPWPV